MGILRSGFRTGLMGNIGTKIGAAMLDTDINTQDPHTLQSNLKKMKDASADFCVMEVSSQGLHMGRVLGCEFRTAVFTNLTQDHLDYHGSMDNYLAAKGTLFSRMGNSFSPDPAKRKFAILNADDEASKILKSLTAAQVITYGIKNPADIMAKEIQLTSKGTTFQLLSSAGTTTIELNLVGTFNVYNALAAISTALAEQIPIDVIQAGLLDLTTVSGRMEVIDEGQDFLVLADYAHSPDGLDNALSTLCEFADKKIITVFGCGGDRDRTKRPIMGKLAAAYSDFVIVTSDNPRTEDPKGILIDIEHGLKEFGASPESYELIEDRRQAIERAIEMAGTGDIVLIAGKGHETYQILKDRTVHFDDREEAREAIRKRVL
ncbi:UDP-N-acetylmuramoyl-L-alanyl-D-glutamate--2,6-diaminopimelate ligase [Paenibacillus eucommiae]|uniref:UDP-N-acetylmuramoyl-L-alanyl-D-glutamate--2, 6-diaminopimelate ligase n=1 Tax=Paenibacillus eucommiae TaxID=1355755 RepID=A0ABS4J4Y0_9BACL|nr:UDP-N-acetylmuramoyl-L-alanyl-D-glutamate--2,6-diaminopimelate ligase [Paenibacillus eucommiae]MBP1994894.1 UDP-N-acetylmuramoyl-L-alanyl-D-glutamate--2,6-diaminopimelate ligase [Paenibacillus eucommiae]